MRSLPLAWLNIFVTDVLEMWITSQMEYVFSFDLFSHISNMSRILTENITFFNEKPNDCPGINGNYDFMTPLPPISFILDRVGKIVAIQLNVKFLQWK